MVLGSTLLVNVHPGVAVRRGGWWLIVLAIAGCTESALPSRIGEPVRRAVGVPAVTSFSPASGGYGTSVTVTGSNFTGVTVVRFNGTAALSITVNSDTQLTAAVPEGASTGPVS